MIDIPALDYNFILKAVGYPVVKEEDLEYNKEEILTYIIEPVVRSYFSWFPITETESHYVGAADFEFPFPSDDTFGVVDVRLNPNNSTIGVSSSPFLNAMNFHIGSRKKYGTDYDYGMEEAYYLKHSYDLSRIDDLRALKVEVDKNNRKVKGFANDNGELIITWAKSSNDFNKIPFDRKNEVLQLCQAELMRSIALIRSQLDPGTGVTLNTDEFISRADSLEEKVMNKWKALSKVVVIRG